VRAHGFALLVAAEVGACLWFALLIVITARLTTAFASAIRRYVDRVSGLLLCGFGARLLYTTGLHPTSVAIAYQGEAPLDEQWANDAAIRGLPRPTEEPHRCTGR
jgi:hypothetical protein